MNDVIQKYVQVRSDELERMKNELQELRGDKAQLEETVAVLQLNAKNNKGIIETCAAELEELRKHEAAWDLAQARIKELEAEKNLQTKNTQTKKKTIASPTGSFAIC